MKRRRPDLHAEQGIALTVAIMSLALMIMLGGVALKQAVAALSHTNREMNVKRALQAADAALDDATYAVARADIGNTLDVDLLNPTSLLSQNCIVSTGSVAGIDLSVLDPLTPKDPSGAAWCPETAAQTTSDNANYSYRISQLVRAGAGNCGVSGALNLDRDVVGVGRSGTVVRRVKAHLNASLAVLSGAAVQASGPGTSPAALTMSGTASILGDAESNGSISGSGLNVISGNATPGKNGTVNGVVPAGSSSKACELFTIPEVDATGVSATANPTIGKTCANILFITLPLCLDPPDYDSSTRTLTIDGSGRATLQAGGTYMFCSIVMKGNGVLQIPPGSNTRIFLDDPANCRYGNGTAFPGAGTISVTESARIVNCHLPTQPESLQIYAVGNATFPTTQTIAASALSAAGLLNACGAAASVTGVPLTLIAPHSTIALGSSTAIAGQVAGEVVNMTSAAKVLPINALVNISRLGANPILPLYKATKYVECTGLDFSELPPSDPAQGC